MSIYYVHVMLHMVYEVDAADPHEAAKKVQDDDRGKAFEVTGNVSRVTLAHDADPASLPHPGDIRDDEDAGFYGSSLDGQPTIEIEDGNGDLLGQIRPFLGELPTWGNEAHPAGLHLTARAVGEAALRRRPTAPQARRLQDVLAQLPEEWSATRGAVCHWAQHGLAGYEETLKATQEAAREAEQSE